MAFRDVPGETGDFSPALYGVFCFSIYAYRRIPKSSITAANNHRSCSVGAGALGDFINVADGYAIDFIYIY